LNDTPPQYDEITVNAATVNRFLQCQPFGEIRSAFGGGVVITTEADDGKSLSGTETHDPAASV
jgi:hypothetical protein